MSLMLVLTLATSAPQMPAEQAQALPSARSASARASVRIVKPFRLVEGDQSAVQGAARRTSEIRDQDGLVRQAELVEFE